MAITGTITIPEKVINITDITCIMINKENIVSFSYSNEEESGTVSCLFEDFWGALTDPYKAGIRALPQIIVDQSDDNVSISGEF